MSTSSSSPPSQDSNSHQSSFKIDTLDDTARDTLINQLEDSNSKNLHEILDFDEDDDEEVLINEENIHNIEEEEDEMEEMDEGELINSIINNNKNEKKKICIENYLSSCTEEEEEEDEDEDDEEEEGEDIDDDDGEIEIEKKKKKKLLLKNNINEKSSSGELTDDDDDDDEEEGEDKKRNENLEDGEVEEEEEIEEGEEGEEKKEELEEGEVTDDEDRNKIKPICRFFGKGQCTWGSNCRFLHPGVTDKGLYTMFEPIHRIPQPQPIMPSFKTGLLGHAPPNFIPIIKVDEPILIESAWERGLRTAKEIIKQSVKRKETDVDFEEKKMNLNLGQEEIDKENDYYKQRGSSPVGGEKEEGTPPSDFDPYLIQPIIKEWQKPPLDVDFVRDRVHHLNRSLRAAPPRSPPGGGGGGGGGGSVESLPPSRDRPQPNAREEEVRLVRESAIRRSRFQDGFRGVVPQQQQQQQQQERKRYNDSRKNAEEWNDPWNPGTIKKRKDSSLSKRSSYSSGSSSSSSTSSSSTSGSKRVRKVAPPRVGQQQRMSPKPVRIAPPLSLPEKTYQEIPRRNFEIRRFAPPINSVSTSTATTSTNNKKSSPILQKQHNNNNKKLKKKKWSSGESHDDWSSESRSPSPKARSKFTRNRKSWSKSSSSDDAIDMRASNTMGKKRKLDSPQIIEKKHDIGQDLKSIQQHWRGGGKQQQQQKSNIKLTVKSNQLAKSNKTVLDKLADDIDASSSTTEIDEPSSPQIDLSPVGIGCANATTTATSNVPAKKSRRDELLKQLKAVEDAIAKKRSKLI